MEPITEEEKRVRFDQMMDVVTLSFTETGELPCLGCMRLLEQWVLGEITLEEALALQETACGMEAGGG